MLLGLHFYEFIFVPGHSIVLSNYTIISLQTPLREEVIATSGVVEGVAFTVVVEASNRMLVHTGGAVVVVVVVVVVNVCVAVVGVSS